MKKLIWLNYILAYTMWIVVILLGLWFLYISRTALLSVLTIFYAKDSALRSLQVPFVDRIYSLIVGLLLSVLITVTEIRFRQGVRESQLLKRFAQVFGPELLLIFVADLILLLIQGVVTISWSRWLLLAVELLAGIGFSILARSASLTTTTNLPE
ncbi:MAG: hypothetical protein JXA33_02725 [Anaerolineae bacterium]|nr:hypothetical protein [Anaerolineae bacterium]